MKSIMLSTSNMKKRDFATMDSDCVVINDSDTQCTNNTEKSSTTPSAAPKEKRCKKFRREWMEEEHFKDWLQPYPGEDTMCACIACNIVLRCGKSELYKHASGLKHTRRVAEMKAGTSRRRLVLSAKDDSQAVQRSIDPFDQFLSQEDEHVWVPVQADSSLEENCGTEENGGASSGVLVQEAISDSKLTEALVKLFEFADGKIDLSRKRLEMLQEEHTLKMQILQKELLLKSLEVEIKQAELKKLKLEMDQTNSKDNTLSESSQLTIHDHPLVLHHPMQLQEALQTQLQQLQGAFNQGQNTKEQTLT